MCDRKLEQNISVVDRSSHGASTDRSTSTVLNEKNIFEACGNDSGFFSGQNLSRDFFEEEVEVRKRIDPEQTSADDKPSNLTNDHQSKDNIDQFSDTTAIDRMILDSGIIDDGLNEWFCGMSIDGNNLNSSSRAIYCPSKVEQPKQNSIKQEIPLWQKAYGQNDEGDT